ncbi:MAG: hypothetical protein AAF828_07810, partial [Bacteroidota bacterium]
MRLKTTITKEVHLLSLVMTIAIEPIAQNPYFVVYYPPCNLSCMKKVYYPLLIGLFLICNSLGAESLRGFLLTKDNYRLTGYINKIEYSLTGIMIQFTNDFGDQYNIYPNLVNGFGFTNGGETFRYVSRYHEGRWLFLKAIDAGKRLSLFQSPDGKKRWVDDSFQTYVDNPLAEYWIQFRGNKLVPVQRAGFKR